MNTGKSNRSEFYKVQSSLMRNGKSSGIFSFVLFFLNWADKFSSKRFVLWPKVSFPSKSWKASSVRGIYDGLLRVLLIFDFRHLLGFQIIGLMSIFLCALALYIFLISTVVKPQVKEFFSQCVSMVLHGLDQPHYYEVKWSRCWAVLRL